MHWEEQRKLFTSKDSEDVSGAVSLPPPHFSVESLNHS